MSELIESLEKSIKYLRERYPDGLTLLTSLEAQLASLKAKQKKSSGEIPSTEKPLE